MIEVTYVTIINIISFIIYGYDKYCAVINKWRVSEFTLLLIAAGGGALGALLAMYGFHHKTHNKKFQIGIPLFLTIHILLLIIIL